jgi:Flp pilus assembly secretin CpaC
MSARSVTAGLTAAVLLAGLLARASAQTPCAIADGKCHGHAAGENLVQRVYPVADLIVPLDNYSVPATACNNSPAMCGATCCSSSEPQASGKTLEGRLMDLIVHTVAPASWSARGGPALMEYYPLGMALVVRQTPAAHDEIEHLLAALRRLQDLEVAIEVRLLSVSDGFMERIGKDFSINLIKEKTKQDSPLMTGLTPAGNLTPDLNIPVGRPCFPTPVPACGSSPCKAGADSPPAKVTIPRDVQVSAEATFLNDIQAAQFMEAIQGDQRSNVLQAPKLTLADGQTATLRLTDLQNFVTGIEWLRVGEQVVPCPRKESVETGLRLSVLPVVSADRRFVRLNLKADVTDLDSGMIPVFPVTAPVPTAEEGGAPGQPAMATQFIQQPKVTTLGLEKTLSIPDGGTVLLGGWKRLREARNEFGPPVLSRIPYVNRLFKNVGYGREAETVLMMVTPRIIVHDEEKPIRACLPCPQGAPTATPKAAPAEMLKCRVLELRLQDTPRKQPKEKEHGKDSVRDKDKKVAKLLAKYHQACAEGNLDRAHRLAGKALALDPACFSKDHPGGAKRPVPAAPSSSN